MEKKLEHIAEIIRAAAKEDGLAPGVYKMIKKVARRYITAYFTYIICCLTPGYSVNCIEY
ncbi:hypothetical protein FACS1894113_3610 [Alphaproteobacteria bacterium]|nr:hypothetical protein FACS1894113_3610 [Alphaproteobacteria bacterium]